MINTAGKKSSHCECGSWEKVERIVDADFRYYYYQCSYCHRVEYPFSEAQKILDYSKEHVFFFVSDWILVWLCIGDNAPIYGITRLQKQMFIVYYEFAQNYGIPTENPGFAGYKYGPYTERIDTALDSLYSLGFISSEGRLNTDKEMFTLTNAGEEKAKMLLEKLTSEQQEKLHELRRELQQFTRQGITTYIYQKYPDFTKKSIIYERTLHRKRK